MSDDFTSADVRAWARDNGIQVGERGRIPVAIIKQFKAATGR